jgi:Ino eighty subunit 2
MVMADDDDDDELSELSEEEPEEDEDEEEEEEGGDEDAEGEEDEEMAEQENDVDEDMESDDETPASLSPSHIEPSKMTGRQRRLLIGGAEENLVALSNGMIGSQSVFLDSTDFGLLLAEAQKKKHLTAEEHAMRRAEMARRRKNLSEKRNEEEKVRYHFLPCIAVRLSDCTVLTYGLDGHHQPLTQETTSETRTPRYQRCWRVRPR